MSISTTTGDDGTTQVGDRRVKKSSLEVEALGALDEASSALGFARSLTTHEQIRARTETLQRVLFSVSAGIGAPTGREEPLPDGLLDELTSEVHELESREGALTDWALPGDHAGAAAFDLARTACRRAERALVRLSDETDFAAPESLRLLNRMSDLLWLYGRMLEAEAGVNSAMRSDAKKR